MRALHTNILQNQTFIHGLEFYTLDTEGKKFIEPYFMQIENIQNVLF